MDAVFITFFITGNLENARNTTTIHCLCRTGMAHLTGMARCLKAVILTFTCTQRAPISPPIAPMRQKMGTSQT